MGEQCYEGEARRAAGLFLYRFALPRKARLEWLTYPYEGDYMLCVLPLPEMCGTWFQKNGFGSLAQRPAAEGAANKLWLSECSDHLISKSFTTLNWPQLRLCSGHITDRKRGSGTLSASFQVEALCRPLSRAAPSKGCGSDTRSRSHPWIAGSAPRAYQQCWTSLRHAKS